LIPSSTETVCVGLPFFAFQFTGDAQNRHDDVRVLRRLNGFGTGPRIIFRPNQLRLHWPSAALPVTNFDMDLLSLLQVNVPGSRLWRLIADPAVGQWFSIDLDSREPALQTHADGVVSRFSWGEEAAPLDAQRIFAGSVMVKGTKTLPE
jgi:hypothetical protein